ncbi:MAG: acetylglutamate kinase [Myxococcota bacterium]|nr:acetylglutamate kinase [Myxococcota bacterium]
MRLVIKLGGELLARAQEKQTKNILEDVRELQKEGYEVVFVHGGGPQTTALQKALGQEPNIVAGRRITDTETLEAIKMAVGGKVNLELCRYLLAQGLTPISLNGASGGVIRAIRRPPRIVSGCGTEPIDFGLVGDVAGINEEVLGLLLSKQFVPVIACIGADADGALYNINADIVANAVAVALKATHLVLVTGAPGVLRDRNDSSTRIPKLSIEEGKAAIQAGIIADGMIPKMEESFRALEQGVANIHVLGNLKRGDLVEAMKLTHVVGTTLVR